MDILTIDRICVDASANEKQEAIRMAGELLIKTGCVSPEYVEGMLAREATMSTYLGSGVAIPHGMFESRAQISKTGISILQLPRGVDWEEGEKAHLVIGIAAFSDEHVSLLARLAEIIEDEEIVQKLISTNNPQDILEQFTPAQA
jgi:mannitol/fructose-specific phosphotransferase system IIA component